MIRSMTGYASSRKEEGGFSISASVKSSNHRYLDLQVRMSSGLDALEPLLRRVVKERISRGHVELTVNLERADAVGLQINRKLLSAYLEAFRELRADIGDAAHPDLVALLRVPGMVAANNGEFTPSEIEGLGRTLGQMVGEALERLDEMRGSEGASLERDLRSRLDYLGRLGDDVQKLTDSIPGFYQSRLQKRIAELTGNTPAELDATRLAQEVAYLASRSDVAEELTRVKSHLDQAARLLAQGGDAGKKLDFLFQEMNREANTLLSKTTDVPEIGAEVARLALEMKTEVEKLREQAQNIE